MDILVLGALGILGLCLATLWWARARVRGRLAEERSAGRLTVAASVALGRRCRVYLVQVDGRAVLAGVDRAGLKGLLPLAESPEEANLKSATSEPEPAGIETDGQMIVPISKHLSE